MDIRKMFYLFILVNMPHFNVFASKIAKNKTLDKDFTFLSGCSCGKRVKPKQ